MSRLEEWVSTQRTKVAYGKEPSEKRTVTCRLDIGVVDKLDELAAKSGMSRTACAESLLESAITDALETWQDVEERGIPAMPPGAPPEPPVSQVPGWGLPPTPSAGLTLIPPKP